MKNRAAAIRERSPSVSGSGVNPDPTASDQPDPGAQSYHFARSTGPGPPVLDLGDRDPECVCELASRLRTRP